MLNIDNQHGISTRQSGRFEKTPKEKVDGTKSEIGFFSDEKELKRPLFENCFKELCLTFQNY